MKTQIMLCLLCDAFSSAVVQVVVASGGGTVEQIVETAAQSAINEKPGETDVAVLTETALTQIKGRIGMS